MKYALAAALLVVLGFVAPASAAPKHPVYCTSDGGTTTFLVDGQHPYSVPSQLAQYVKPRCTQYIPSFAAKLQEIRAHVMTPGERTDYNTYQLVDSQQQGFYRDSNGALIVSGGDAIGGGLKMPYSMSASDGTQTPTNGSGVGILAFNPFTNTVDRLQVDSSERLVTTATISGSSTISLNGWTTTIVSGSSTGLFGSTICTVPPCIKLIKTGAGVLGGLRWNSLTAMGATTLTCWNATAAGTIDTELFVATNMSPGGTLPLPAGGDAFTVGLFCQTSASISTTQNFTFEWR